MSDQLKEHRPLLREENSDEEFKEDFTQPFRRHMGYRGKARNTIKGAAAIIKNWPDHWSSSVTQWWIGIAMFALITFVFYNSVVAYSMIATANPMPVPQTVADKVEIMQQKNTLPQVFMHIIVNNAKEAELNKYLPYIEIIANQYLHYKFNFIIIRNDTIPEEETIHQAHINNEDALNSLWTAESILDVNKMSSKTKSNINIEYVNLSYYLNNSPVRQFWQRLPYQYMELLVRAVSIWDQGGIAFSPVILTPKSPDAIYIEKLYTLLSSFEELKRPNATKNVTRKIQNIDKPKKINDKQKYKKRVNNIRDIIDALGSDPSDPQSISETLSEAETRQVLTEMLIKPPKTETRNVNNNVGLNFTEDQVLPKHNITDEMRNNSPIQLVQSDNHLTQKNRSELINVMLPSFLDFLFHDKSKTTTNKDDSNDRTTSGHSISTRAIPSDITKIKDDGDNLQAMIVPAPNKFERIPSNVEDKPPMIYDNLENLTIDLKGYILATRKPCHAFLGTIFSNVKNRTKEESLKDFIISELSLFCNGLLSTCKGVDIILL